MPCESRNGISSCNVRVIEPIEENGAIPVNLQDQTTPPLDLYFIKLNGTQTTITIATVIDAIQITVANPASFPIGTYLGIFSGISLRFFFATVTNRVGNVLTIDTPLDFAFPIGSNVLPFTRDMNVLGTQLSPQYFQIQGPGALGLEIDITRFMLSIATATEGQIGDFGDLPALTVGLVLRKIDTVYRYIWNIKTNLEFGLHAYDIQPFSALGPGGDGLICRYSFAGQDKHGVAIRLSQGESLQLVIQDDLRGLTQFRCLAEGHEVQD